MTPEVFTKLTHRRILRCLAKRGVRYADRDDIAQEVWVVVCRRIDTLQDQSKLSAWINGVCRNVTRDVNRKAGRRQRVVESSEDPTAIRKGRAEPRLSVEAQVDLRRTVADLEGIERTIFKHSIEGKTVQEIAGQLGRTPGSVYRHKRKMRSSLERAVHCAACPSRIGDPHHTPTRTLQ